ncbi:lipid IV(A) 3-deoxy-D-manno-octulosonic acid transferase [Vibrio ostreicida]|uniref:3-deoxy-D-manno-octulosonic acid transferase n=1 Tax=Vibrio ostreicida TaxID=526588 RepID=A0ABT8BMY5_9VIBR|nr:lipid IV(A) 3-deoxy-D-manno-octulosonic acid transferase [Vibrio ostreicida]MDN3608501.1 lipid IV(A) 3-deoxy-D-manno-octulosonic acid transferase [Vibrio ostreicida]NPD10323.1 3-deoxy-D-manno-octulosonic acid transferase [Vibrio ostreicida]
MIIRLIYNALLSIVAPVLLYGLFRKRSGKPSVGQRWKEHFGLSDPLDSPSTPLWIHAVSVGETIAATPLIRKLKKQHPTLTILLTTTTPTGAEQAKSLGDLVEHRYMPIDFGFAVRQFLKRVRPSQLLIIETELWPNTLINVRNAGLPITIINARLSEKSFSGYQKVRPLFNLMVPSLTQVLCQYDSDAERFRRLGLPEERLAVTGSIKFDIEINQGAIDDAIQLKRAIGTTRPVWVAASTHKGEDEIVLSAHEQLLRSLPNALLILVPRHPERFESVAQMSSSLGHTVTRTSGQEIDSHTQIYIGNTMGEMLTLIGASDVCFMGGSLVGMKVGGHNLLEPAALAKPILTGPSYYNFTDIAESLIAEDACQVVTNADELYQALYALLNTPHSCQTMGSKALHVVASSSGALNKTIHHITLQQGASL